MNLEVKKKRNKKVIVLIIVAVIVVLFLLIPTDKPSENSSQKSSKNIEMELAHGEAYFISKIGVEKIANDIKNLGFKNLTKIAINPNLSSDIKEDMNIILEFSFKNPTEKEFKQTIYDSLPKIISIPNINRLTVAFVGVKDKENLAWADISGNKIYAKSYLTYTVKDIDQFCAEYMSYL